MPATRAKITKNLTSNPIFYKPQKNISQKFKSFNTLRQTLSKSFISYTYQNHYCFKPLPNF